MERSTSQKVLLVISIISIIGAVFALLAGIMGIFGGGFIGAMSSGEAASLIEETGMAQGDLAGILMGLGFIGIITAIVGMIQGIFGIRASKDATQIGPVWFLAIVSVVLSAIGLALDVFVNHKPFGEMGSQLISLAWSCLTLWICYNIKQQANA